MKCDFVFDSEPDDRGWRKMRCQRCGFLTSGTPHPPDKVHRICNVMGIGDVVAAGLELTGIGPAYRWIRGGKCGGCQQRQATLNELGKKVGL